MSRVFTVLLGIVIVVLGIAVLAPIPTLLRLPTGASSANAAEQSVPENSPATMTVLFNGNIYTVDGKRPRAQALAFAGDRIIGVGSNDDMRKWKGTAAQFIDLKGAFVMPGFNDAHIHLANGGQAKLAVDLTGARSLAEFQDRIRKGLANYKAGEWVTGRGWDHTLWPVKKFPTRQDLDAVSTAHPMIFTRVDGHVAIANSKALELAGVTRTTKAPEGGQVELDAKTGEPTGMLLETAQGLVRRKIPAITAEQKRRGLELALAEATENGITSVQDNSGWDDFLIYRDVKNAGKLTVRVTEWLPFDAPLERLQQMRTEGGTTDTWVRTGAVKGVMDGTLGSRTCAMLAPFADDPSTKGLARYTAEQLNTMAVERDKAGFQLAFHAIGDAANRMALDAFAAAQKANGKRDSRHKIEHAQVIAPADFARFVSLDVIASMQPVHETSDSRWAGQRLGPERSKGAYAWNTFQKVGARLAFGTDYPVEPLNPMFGLYACVTRAQRPGDGDPGQAWIPEEKISMEDCIRHYTAGSAYAEFAEKDKGTLEPGKFADLIVLSADVTKIPAAQIPAVKVTRTIVAGRTVFPK